MILLLCTREPASRRESCIDERSAVGVYVPTTRVLLTRLHLHSSRRNTHSHGPLSLSQYLWLSAGRAGDTLFLRSYLSMLQYGTIVVSQFFQPDLIAELAELGSDESLCGSIIRYANFFGTQCGDEFLKFPLYSCHHIRPRYLK